MPDRGYSLSRLEVVRREQTPQALARLVVVVLFIALWLVFWPLGITMPRPFLAVLCIEAAFFIAYLPIVRRLPSERDVEIAHYVMLASEIIFHTTMVYFLGGITWLGPFAYIFGLVFTNTFLDLKRGAIYTTAAASAFLALILLDASGTIPHYVYLDQAPGRYSDATFVITTAIAGVGVFFSIYLWVNWVGHQLRRQRDEAVIAQSQLAAARADLEHTNIVLETRVSERTAELRAVNSALHAGEGLLRSTIESTADAILVVDRVGQVLHTNQRFAEMWKIPAALLERGTAGGKVLALAMEQVADPEGFAAALRSLSGTSIEGHGNIEFADGRVAEHFSRPLVRSGVIDGRVWSFRDGHVPSSGVNR